MAANFESKIQENAVEMEKTILDSLAGYWTNARTVVVTGAKGMLGQDFLAMLSATDWGKNQNHRIYPWDIDQLDLTKDNDVSQAIANIRPDLIVNCAAYTNVDAAEDNVDLAYAVNAHAAANLATAAGQTNSKLVHISTDYVFDGLRDKPYRPDDATHPFSVYGMSKLAGEQHIRKILKNYIIIRTSWLFGKHGKNFVDTIRRLASQKDRLSIVNDQIGSPTFTVDLSDAILRLIAVDAQGVYHFHNEGFCSWFEFGEEIVRASGLTAAVLPIPSSQYPQKARRPAFSKMDISDFTRMTGHTPRHWKEALLDYLRENPN